MTYRPLILALAMLAACQSDPAPPAPPAPPASATVQPEAPRFEVGEGIGPVRLGMTREDLERLGLPLEERSHDLVVGAYRVMLEGERVTFIEVQLAELPQGLVVGDHRVAPEERDITAIAKHLPGCGEMEMLTGGNVITCEGGTVTVAAAGPPGIVQLQLMTTTSAAFRLR